MGDIFVHLRMKACCRSTLKALDTHKKKAKYKSGVLGVKSLFDMFSGETIDAAKATIPATDAQMEGELETITRSACEKICTKHAEEHGAKGEKQESNYWLDLADAIRGSSAS